MNDITQIGLAVSTLCLIISVVILTVKLAQFEKRIERLEDIIIRFSRSSEDRARRYENKSVFTVRPIRKTKRRSVAKTGEGDGQ